MIDTSRQDATLQVAALLAAAMAERNSVLNVDPQVVVDKALEIVAEVFKRVPVVQI